MSTTTDRQEFAGWQARRGARDDLYQVTYALIDEFEGLLSAGTVISHVIHAREHLLSIGV